MMFILRPRLVGTLLYVACKNLRYLAWEIPNGGVPDGLISRGVKGEMELNYNAERKFLSNFGRQEQIPKQQPNQ